MKIKSIEFENFRNYHGYHKLDFSTDGKVNIIYGKNGVGKTTLHQLLFWVFYNDVNLNKTASKAMYNITLEKDAKINTITTVFARIIFENDCNEYMLERSMKFKKTSNRSYFDKVEEGVSLQYLDEFKGWKSISNNNEDILRFIESVLPISLKDYFFFDGERMISDLGSNDKKAKDGIRKSLDSIFNMKYLRDAILHIGDKHTKWTAIGKLNNEIINDCKKEDGTIEEKEKTRNRFEFDLNKLEVKKQNAELDLKEISLEINKISEEIGIINSKNDNENERIQLNIEINSIDDRIKKKKKNFARFMYTDISKMLLEDCLNKSKQKLEDASTNADIPNGLEKELLEYLINNENGKCICGNKIKSEEIETIRILLKQFPPNSYQGLYKKLNNSYSYKSKINYKENLREYMDDMVDLYYDKDAKIEKISDLDAIYISEKDKEKKKIRKELEEKRNDLLATCTNLDELIGLKKAQHKKACKNLDAIVEKRSKEEKISYKISLLQAVSKSIESELMEDSVRYSELLQKNIQEIINKISTSKRFITVNKEFGVTITDSHDNKSQSEGQFAMFSFAYIGAIMKIIKDNNINKEYPLILDGPFSKLDEDQRENVIKELPYLAEQVIIFSKDDISEIFEKDKVGRVYTIESNDEKNKSLIKEGLTWN